MQYHFHSIKPEVVAENLLLFDPSALFFGSAFFLSQANVSSSSFTLSTKLYFYIPYLAFYFSRRNKNYPFFRYISLFFFSSSAYFFLNSSFYFPTSFLCTIIKCSFSLLSLSTCSLRIFYWARSFSVFAIFSWQSNSFYLYCLSYSFSLLFVYSSYYCFALLDILTNSIWLE